MNNLKYYNDSLAYDFEMFAPKTKEKTNTRDNIVVMPSAASKKKTKTVEVTEETEIKDESEGF